MEKFKISGIEPHIFLNCSRRYDDFEENIFSLTWGRLFTSMQTDINVFQKPLRHICSGLSFTKEDDEPFIEFRASEISKRGYYWVFNKFMTMQSKRLIITEENNLPQISFPLFSSIENRNPFIRCYFSPISLRYLLYFGKGVGGCFFNVMASISMGSGIKQRLYRLICSNMDKLEVCLSVETLKHNYNVPNYDFHKLKDKIIDPFINKLRNNPYDPIECSYEPIYGHSSKAGRPAVKTIKFNFKPRKHEK